MLNKRVLIFSNNPISKSNSNGRTLLNMFDGEDADKLAQFYLQAGEPDFSACSRFFFSSDSAVVKAFLKKRSAGREVCTSEFSLGNGVKASSSKRKVGRNPFTMLVRNFFWNRKIWREEFDKWVHDFAPECILLQAGDSPFLYNISLEYAKKYSIPLVVYNSEDYYFKNYNYFRKSGLTAVLYPLFRTTLKRAVKKVMDYASTSVYISEDLASLYYKEFEKPSEYIYTSTDVLPNAENISQNAFSYLGNLGIDRHIGLVKIAEALAEIDSSYKLDVYGKIPNDDVKKAFDSCTAINYKGFISYDDVKRVIANSRLLFHTECTDPFYCKDVKYGFSTKIPDSLASGTCLVIFAPEMLACTKYVMQNECGCVITEETQLVEKLREVIFEEAKRDTYIKNALSIVEKNHNIEKNRKKMAEIINRA